MRRLIPTHFVHQTPSPKPVLTIAVEASQHDQTFLLPVSVARNRFNYNSLPVTVAQYRYYLFPVTAIQNHFQVPIVPEYHSQFVGCLGHA